MAEDKGALVEPVEAELRRRGIIPWLDREDYDYGKDSRTALRDGLLRSRHVIFFVTQKLMDHRRGWCPMELAYADIIQANLFHAGGPLLNYSLPLYFIDRADHGPARTVWGALRDRACFHLPTDGDPVPWAVEQIEAFLRREQALAAELAKVAAPRKPVHKELSKRSGLVERVTQFDPGILSMN
ncbi:MAG: toll/interleukin-1 receptor domain-containing protein [Gemmataceae bacterium]|nr:toll/interleukin-1 receptor domain-containing protein [Gemmataceae bacterium]